MIPRNSGISMRGFLKAAAVVASLCLIFFGFTGCEPNLKPIELTADQQSALAKIAGEDGGSYYVRDREAAVEKLTDQALLAKIALEAKYYSVQKAAVNKLTDQGLLAKIAMEVKYSSLSNAPIAIGQYAIDKISDPALLAKIAVGGKVSYVRFAAVNKLTDQTMLAKLCIEAKNAELCQKAMERLDDQGLLAKVVFKAKYKEMRKAAFAKLKTADQVLLVKVAMEAVDEELRWAAYYRLCKLSDFPAGLTQLSMAADDPALRLYASLLLKIHSAFQSYPKDVGTDWRLRNILFETVCILANPDVNTELGDLEDIWMAWTPRSAQYSLCTVYGENVTLSAKLGKMDQTIVHRWSTNFPLRVEFQKGTSPFVEAKVNVADFFQDICGFLSEAALGKVALASGHPGTRLAAVKTLTAQTVLAKVAVEDGDWNVSRAATEKLTDPVLLAEMGMWVKPELTRLVTDQALLAKIAVEANGLDVRRAAVEKIDNQSLLAKVVWENKDKNPQICLQAVEKLTDQAVLAKIAMEEAEPTGNWGEWDVRLAAVAKVSDQAVLSKLVAPGGAPLEVRNAADHRLFELRKGKPKEQPQTKKAQTP